MPNEAEPLGHAEGEVAMQPTDSTSVGSDRKGAGRARKAVSLPKAPTWLANAGSYFRVSSPPLIQPPARLAEFSGLIVALICSLFIFSTLHPDLIFSNTVTTANCIPDSLALIVAPPTPVLPTATPTLVPSVTPTPGLIIVLPLIFFYTNTSTPTPKFFIPPIIIINTP